MPVVLRAIWWEGLRSARFRKKRGERSPASGIASYERYAVRENVNSVV